MADRTPQDSRPPPAGQDEPEPAAGAEADGADDAGARLDQRAFRGGRGGRFWRMASLASRVSGSYFGQRLKRVVVGRQRADLSLTAAHARNAERIARTFGDLKGAVMKVGQMLSQYADILPAEYTEVLARLQNSAPPVAFDTIADQLAGELGRPPDRVFSDLEEQPFASASIGQVHRGQLPDGRQVAIKVQYPGVEHTVDSDVKNLRMVLRSVGLMRRGRGGEELIAEVQARLREELDYRRELEHLKLFRRLLGDDDRLRLPAPIESLTTRRVLVLEYVAGQDFAGFCAAADQATRDRVGQTLFDVFLRQFLVLGALHADPNPANFAFLPDGRMVLYDFGCVRRFEPEFTAAYIDLLRDALAGRNERLVDDLARVGVVPIADRGLDAEVVERFAEPILEPFRASGDYDFGQSRIHREVIRLGMEHWQAGFDIKVPPEMVFLDRVIVGMYHNLRALGARGDWRRVLLPYLERPPSG